jgi:isopentenyl-diphosphate delta-isomerase
MSAHEPAYRVVSFDDEPLILVDEHDRVQGYAPKGACHDGVGTLHRAFSVFLFDDEGHVLLQQRSADKRLWPLYWSNACCSHPRRGESVLEAAVRRTGEELALEARLRFAFKFLYHAPFGEAGAEHELCSVFVGKVRGQAHFNPHEIAATRLMAPAELDGALADPSTPYTPWLRLEWPRLRREHARLIAGMLRR